MGQTAAFQLSGLSVSLTTNAAPATSQSALIKLSDLGMLQAPAALRVVNNGAVDIWMSITPAAAAAVLPTPGTTTAGTPTAGLRLKPGVVEVFTLAALGLAAGGAGVPGFFVNTISANATQAFDLSPGEGL